MIRKRIILISILPVLSAVLLSFMTLKQDNVWVPVTFFATFFLSFLTGFVLAVAITKLDNDRYSYLGIKNAPHRIRLNIYGCILLSSILICIPATLIIWFTSWKFSLAYIAVMMIIVSLIVSSSVHIAIHPVAGKIIVILVVIIALGAFIGLNIVTYDNHIGIAAVPIMVAKWQGKICDYAFCTELATRDVHYGLLGSADTLHFCDKHVSDAPQSIISSNRHLWNLIASGAILIAFAFLIYRIYAAIIGGLDELGRNIGWLLLSMAIFYIVPTVAIQFGVGFL